MTRFGPFAASTPSAWTATTLKIGIACIAVLAMIAAPPDARGQNWPTTDRVEPCDVPPPSPEQIAEVNRRPIREVIMDDRDEPWLQFGPYPWGVTEYDGEVEVFGAMLPHKLQIWYPAQEEGEDVPVAAIGAPFPAVFFAHAGGSHYTWYDYQFSRLASHGMIVVSAYHDGGWDPWPFWDRHRELFVVTIDLMAEWNDDPDSPFFSAVDFDRLALSGHCHGAAGALLAVQLYRPMTPDAEYEVKCVCQLAACPPDPISSYLSSYAGMPPLQVIYGSRDSDGCVAWGQSIAIYEPGTRSKHYAYVVGANHYVFAEGGSLWGATISRTEAFRASAASMVAFHAWTLNGDESALPYLRGDLPLLEGPPEVRYQFHDVEHAVVDSCEVLGPAHSVAVAGIPGQTFINGFLSDAFADFEAGVQLVREEIHSLLAAGPGCHTVLYYEDVALGNSVYLEAIAREEDDGFFCEPVTTSSASGFATLISSDQWDLIVAAHQAGSSGAEHPFDAPLAAYVCGGGKVIISDWRTASSGAAATLACSDTAFDGQTNWVRMTSTSDLFTGQLELQNPGWSVFSVGLTTDAVVYATNELLGSGEHDAATNSLGLPVVAEGLLTFVEDFMLQSERGLYHPTGGLEFAWDAPGATFTETLSDDDEGFDALQWQVLSFRILQLHNDELNPADETQDLHVRLTDVDGDAAQVALSDALQGPLRYAVEPWAVDWKSVFETYRLPLVGFVQANPALNLRHLAAIEFVCDITDTGRLIIDDIEFASRKPLLGDLNCDGSVNFFDVGPFVLALSHPAAYGEEYPDCDILRADCNGDGLVNFFDIDPFVELIVE